MGQPAPTVPTEPGPAHPTPITPFVELLPMLMALDSSHAAAAFLRERLPHDVKRGLHMLREHDRLSPESAVGGAVRALLRINGFDESRIGAGSLRDSWSDLMDAVLEERDGYREAGPERR